jgi:hypothetical protein
MQYIFNLSLLQKRFRLGSRTFRRHDTQNNDTQHYDAQHNGNKHNDTTTILIMPVLITLNTGDLTYN